MMIATATGAATTSHAFFSWPRRSDLSVTGSGACSENAPIPFELRTPRRQGASALRSRIKAAGPGCLPTPPYLSLSKGVNGIG